MDQSGIEHYLGIIIDFTNNKELSKQTFLNFIEQYPQKKDISYIKFQRIEGGLQLDDVSKLIEKYYYSSIYFLEFPENFKYLDQQYRVEINKLKEHILYLEEELQEKQKEIIIREEKIADLSSIVTQMNTSEESNTINNLFDQKDEALENDLIQQIKQLQLDQESRCQDTEESQNYGIYQQIIYEQVQKHKSELIKKCDLAQKRLLKAFFYASQLYMESQNVQQNNQNQKNINIFNF